VISFAGQL